MGRPSAEPGLGTCLALRRSRIPEMEFGGQPGAHAGRGLHWNARGREERREPDGGPARTRPGGVEVALSPVANPRSAWLEARDPWGGWEWY